MSDTHKSVNVYKKPLFGLSRKPRNPELQPGELLLLQLDKHEAELLGKLESRIDFTLVFDYLEHDPDGAVSRSYWPQAIQTWSYNRSLFGAVPTVPFSLELLNLSASYSGQQNPRYIVPEDEKIILRYLQWNLGEVSDPEKQVILPLSWRKSLGRRAERAKASHIFHRRCHCEENGAGNLESVGRRHA